MSDQETPTTPAKRKSNPMPFIAFLLIIIFAGGAIAFGILWFTNQPTDGEETAAFLPPDTKMALHIRGLNEMAESVKAWGGESGDTLALLNEVAGGIDMSGFDQALAYCKTQVRGDCRLIIAVREWPDTETADMNVEPILMLEGREHQAVITLLSKGSSATDIKIEDVDADIKKVTLSETMTIYLTNRGPFIAASESLENIKYLVASKESPYIPTAASHWVAQWSAEPVAMMIDMPSLAKRYETAITEFEQSMTSASDPAAVNTKDIASVMFKTARELLASMRGGFLFFDLSTEGMKLRLVADVKDDSPYGKSLSNINTAEPKMELLSKLPRGYAFYTGSTPDLTKLEPLIELQQAIQSAVLGNKIAPDATFFSGLKQSAAGTSFVLGQGISQVAVYEYEKPKAVLDGLTKIYEGMNSSDIYKQANLKMTMQPNAGDYQGIKFHKITTDLGLQDLQGSEAGAAMGMLMGDGVLTQWIGADDKYLYQMIGPKLEDIGKVFDQLKSKEPGLGASPTYTSSLKQLGAPLLAGGLIDIESLIAPFAMFLAPGLITPGEEPNYFVMGLSAPEQAMSFDIWLPKPLFDKLSALAQKFGGAMGGLGGGATGGNELDLGEPLGDDYGTGDEYGGATEAPFEIEETP